MPDRDQDLSLTERTLLLGLRDEKGTTESRAGMFKLALGGALLAELLLEGAVEVSGPKDKLSTTGASPLPDSPLLLECLGKLEQSKKTRPAAYWVSKFANLPKLQHRIAEALCSRGILTEEEGKVLFLFSRRTFPTQDFGPELDLVSRLRAAVLGGEQPSEEDTVLLSIAHATGLARVHFDRKELREHKARFEQLADGSSLPEAARATLAAVRAVQVAIMVAVAASAAAGAAGG